LPTVTNSSDGTTPGRSAVEVSVPAVRPVESMTR
jgi:hypothetical protein